jgi:hypothetical protein
MIIILTTNLQRPLISKWIFLTFNRRFQRINPLLFVPKPQNALLNQFLFQSYTLLLAQIDLTALPNQGSTLGILLNRLLLQKHLGQFLNGLLSKLHSAEVIDNMMSV